MSALLVLTLYYWKRITPCAPASL